MRRTRSRPHIAYECHGEEGPPVLFIMGYTMAGAVWRANVDALKDDHRCAFYDHLGLGDSEAPRGRVTMGSMADDVLRVLDDLAWDTAHVVGVSMGGMIAQELALRAQARCRSLTLIATHGGSLPARLPTLEAVRTFARMLTRRQDRRSALERLLYPDDFLRALDPEVRRKATAPRLARPAPPRTALAQLGAIARHHTEERLPALRLPVLLVRPGRDILVRPGATDRIAQRLPHAQVVRFDDAGHGVLFHKADEIHRALRDHVRRAEG